MQVCSKQANSGRGSISIPTGSDPAGRRLGVRATWPGVSRLRRSQRRPTLFDLANQCADQAKLLGVLRPMSIPN
jgi:hypothetical protein